MPQNSSFRLTRSHRFFAKNRIYGFEAKSRWGHPRGHLGANRVTLGQKNGSKRRKLPCPEILIFDDPAVIDYSQKMEVTVMAPNHDGDPLGAILGPMGSHWVKKWVKTVKNYHAPKFEFSTTHWFFWKNGSYGSDAKSWWGPPRVHLGANGSKKWVKTVKITMPQNSNFRLPHGHRFFAKNGSYIYSAKSRSGLPRVHLGANGVPLGPKNGSKRENYHAPKFEFSTTPRSSIFPKKWKLRLWRQITLGTS